MSRRIRVFAAVFALFCLNGCQPVGGDSSGSRGPGQNEAGTAERPEPAADQLRRIRLRLNWFPEAEHGGYYAALVHGYFRDAGLDVTILAGGPGVPVREEVATGRVEFGISNADQILVARAQEADVVGVFAALQTSPRCIMVHRKSGIRRFDQLRNLTLAINQNSSFGAFLKHRVSLEGCQFEPYPGNVARFLLNEDFAQQAYVFSEPYLARKKGGDPVVLPAADIGFNPYTSVLITHGDLIRNDAPLVRSVVAAVQRGWQHYLRDPSATNARIQSENPEIDTDILAHGAEDLVSLCATSDDQPLGHMTLERWSSMAEQLEDCGFSDPGTLSPGDAFTVRFIPDDQEQSVPDHQQ